MVPTFFVEVKKAGCILTKFWYSRISVFTKLVLAVLSFLLSLKHPGFDNWVWWLSSCPGASCCCGWRAGWDAGCMAGAGLVFRCVLFGLQIVMKIKKFC